jgi:tellurite resistance protein TehA-like permease
MRSASGGTRVSGCGAGGRTRIRSPGRRHPGPTPRCAHPEVTAARWARLLVDSVPPAGGAAVMGTGIVSIGLALDHQQTLSQILLGIAAVFWLGLLTVFVSRRRRQRTRWQQEARAPDALTLVAGTAVLGDRLTLLGADWGGYLLLALSLFLWLVLLPRVLGHRTRPTLGVGFMLTVATESLAVLAALLALEGRLAWLAVSALAPLVLGLCAYLLVFARVDLYQLLLGRGDHWIFGGALAIATLACARTAAALSATSTLDGIQPALHDATLALWAAAALWLPALLTGEVIAPRLAYDTRRWSTVFPFGMYAVCSIAIGSISGIGGISDFGRVWIWLALAVWSLALVGMLGRAVALAPNARRLRSELPSRPR